MGYKVEKLEGSMAKLIIDVSAEEFDAACEKAYQKNKKRISIPGFRAGKVPRNVAEKMYGKEAVCYPTLEAELAGANVPAKEVAHDGNIITSRGMGTSIAFAGEIVKTVLDKETADELLKSLVYKQF